MIGKNIFFSSVAYIINALVPVLSIPLLSNGLGIKDYGNYIFYVTILSVISTIIDYNFSTYGIIYVSKRKSYTPIISRLLLAAGTGLIFLVFISPLMQLDSKIILIFEVFILFYALNTQFFLIAVENTLPLLYSALFSKLVFLLLLATREISLISALIFYVVSVVIQSAIVFTFSLTEIKKHRIGGSGSPKDYLMDDYSSFFVNLAGFFAGNMHIFLAKLVLGSTLFGELAVYDRVVRSLASFYASVTSNIVTRIIKIEDDQSRRRTTLKIWLVLCTTYTAVASLIPGVLSFLKLSFGGVIIDYNLLYLIFVFWGFFATTAGYFGVLYLVAQGMSKLYVKIYLLAIFFSLLLFLFIKNNAGLYSMGTILLISEAVIVISIISSFFGRRKT